MDRCDWCDIPDEFLVVQGKAQVEDMKRPQILAFFSLIAVVLDMKPAGDPYLVYGDAELPNGDMSPGYCAFMPWVTSGAQVYTWEDIGRIVVVLHSCKKFEHKQAKEAIVQHFNMIAWKAQSLTDEPN